MFIQALRSSGSFDRAATQAAEDAREGQNRWASGKKFLMRAQDVAYFEGMKFDSKGNGRIHLGGQELSAGRFNEVAIGEMPSVGQSRASSSLWFVEGKHPVLDVASLQATAPARSLFQVASQFNALEAPTPEGLVRPAEYVYDNTQGPRASVSAYGALLLRHYAAPGPFGRFEQKTDDWQINLLSRVTGKGLAQVHNGYLLPTTVTDTAAFDKKLKQEFTEIKVGVHEDVEVTFGANWFGPVHTNERIAQVFTSTIAGGSYGSLNGPKMKSITELLLLASYLGTLRYAATAGKEVVVLTLIGGGVFENPLAAIVRAIVSAYDESVGLSRRGMMVVVNCRDGIPPGSKELARERNGGVVKVSSAGKVSTFC